MTTSLYLGLKEDLGLNLSAANDHHLQSATVAVISFHILLILFSISQSILLAVGTNFKPLDSNEISEGERFLLERFINIFTNKFTILLLSVKLCYFLSKHYHLICNCSDPLYY